jgi:hypothetical protein
MAHSFSPPLRRLAPALFALALLAAALPAAFAQGDTRYFPETGHSLRGQFRAYWEANGALTTFGYPISEEYADAAGRTVQWFERSRFELAQVNGQAQVALGNLGVEATSGRIFPKAAPVENGPNRRYIPETQHIIKYGFKEIWEARGEARIFGNPISEEIDEVLDDGEWHTVQYFEKARFEYWPNLPAGQRVLFSSLGRRLAPADRTAPAAPAPTAAPGSSPALTATPAPSLPPGVNGSVAPASGPPGTSFTFAASGFEAGEKVGIWLTAPDQATFGANFQATADGSGSIAGAKVAITTDTSYKPGLWSFNAQGVRSKKQAVGYFRIAAGAVAGDPGKLGAIVHDQLPRQGVSFIVPVAAPPGATFVLAGGGFTKGEGVGAWITGPDGKSTAIDDSKVKVDGTTAQVVFATAGLPEGVYTAVAQGRSSKVIAAAAFKLTRDYVAGPGTPRPASVNGGATPEQGGQGTTFQIRGQGLQANEALDLWVTDPTGSYVLLPDKSKADSSGRIGYSPALDLPVNTDAPAGVYGVHYRGVSSGVRVDVYFTVVGSTRALPGAGGWLTQALGRPGLR